MIATYAAVLAVCGASLAIGQAAIALCGIRRWSWLSPAVGLALLCAICWGTVRLPGDGTVPAVLVLLLSIGAVLYLKGRVEDGREALVAGLPVALAALAAASIPFAVEGHFGILGTSLNPDMSQHLLATDRLAHGEGGQLLNQGYPLGPHAVVVSLSAGLGIGLVQGFSGLTVAVAVLAPLAALSAFSEHPPLRRTAAALLVGLPYLVASYFGQGAFKETMQALFVLAFVLSLRETSQGPWRGLPLRFVPAALIAVGSVYVYSFPGLIWLVGALLIWLALERRVPLRPLLLAFIVFLVGALPELGRMIDFQRFETFDPDGPGLGNLFGQLSPFTALGIWPSGDYRLAPGDGMAPAFAYYFGAAFAALLLLYGLSRCIRTRESAVLAAAAAAAGAYAAARAGGTPYTAAKALEIAAPLVTLAILLPLLRRPVAVLYILAAGGCSLLALANGPVGPTSYSPALTGLRPLLERDATLVLASDRLLTEEHGTPYLAWELRGGRVCIASEDSAGDSPPPGVRFVVVRGTPEQPPFSGLRVRRLASPYVLWEKTAPVRGPSPCPLIAVRQARQGPAG
ncbi:MAG: hypothetical protein WD827_06050 [Solirubrobacterales bacterium]